MGPPRALGAHAAALASDDLSGDRCGGRHPYHWRPPNRSTRLRRPNRGTHRRHRSRATPRGRTLTRHTPRRGVWVVLSQVLCTSESGTLCRVVSSVDAAHSQCRWQLAHVILDDDVRPHTRVRQSRWRGSSCHQAQCSAAPDSVRAQCQGRWRRQPRARWRRRLAHAAPDWVFQAHAEVSKLRDGGTVRIVRVGLTRLVHVSIVRGEHATIAASTRSRAAYV